MTFVEETAPFEIRAACRDDWDEAMTLAWRTFLQFEAEDYKPEGIRNFEDFITDTTLYRMFVMGEYQMFVACSEGKLVGMISLRGNSHVSLLFVDKRYHRQGIGKALVACLCSYLKTEVGVTRITVNAAPYGIGFYHKIGFRDLGPEMEKDGIRYTPMEFVL